MVRNTAGVDAGYWNELKNEVRKDSSAKTAVVVETAGVCRLQPLDNVDCIQTSDEVSREHDWQINTCQPRPQSRLFST